MRSHLLTVLGLSLALCATARAEFHAEYAPVDAQAEGIPTLTRIEVAGGHMRMDTSRVSLLFDAATTKLIALLHMKKKFMDTKKAQAAPQETVDAAEKMSPEHRAILEKQGKTSAPDTHSAAAEMTRRVTLKATGTNERVHDIACTVYRTEINGRHMQDMCLAAISDTGIGAEDQALLQHAFDEIKAMSEKGAGARAPVPAMTAGKFPLRITRFTENGKVRDVVELKSIANGGVNAADFAIPAGYTDALHSPAAAH
jgi:hypothetical protein